VMMAERITTFGSESCSFVYESETTPKKANTKTVIKTRKRRAAKSQRRVRCRVTPKRKTLRLRTRKIFTSESVNDKCTLRFHHRRRNASHHDSSSMTC